jgi:YVTN family beta-propeller protein
VAAAKLAGRFAQLVREGVSAAGGVLLELRGDEALAVFSSPRQALLAAVALQIRFAEESVAAPESPLGVGIGLDVGEAVAVEGGYRGGALNLAARLCAVAGPGEVLASSGIAHLAGHVEGLRYVERRPVKLKGLPAVVRALQVLPEEASVGTLPRWERLRARAGRSFVDRPRSPVRVVAMGAVAVIAVVTVVVLTLTRGGQRLGMIQANSAGLIDARAGSILDSVAVGTRPLGVAAFRGAIWMTNGSDDTVSRIDPTKRSVIDTIDVGGGPAGIAGGGGAIWVANSTSRSVSEINPDLGKVVQTITVGNGPQSIAIGGGMVWVANSVDGTVSRIDPARGRVTRTIPVGPNPSGLAFGSHSLWVSDETTGTVTRLDTNSGRVLKAIGVSNDPSDIAFGRDGVWVANGTDGTVSRIDPALGAVAATVHVGRDIRALAVGPTAVWAADARDDAIIRIDSRSAVVTRRIEVGGSPQALALTGGQLWLAAGASPRMHRGGTLRLQLPFVQSIDPAFASAPDELTLDSMVYDGLVTLRRVGGTAGAAIVADLATGVPRPAADGKSYTFTLRPGLRYASGAPVRTVDFRHALERALKSSQASSYYDGILGANACVRKPTTCDLSRGVATDEVTRTITFQLTAPDADFLYKLALPYAAAIPSGTPSADLSHHAPPGTGPYEIAGFGLHAVRLVRNPRFKPWSEDAQPDGFPDQIAVRVDGNAGRRVKAVLAGSADFAAAAGLGPSVASAQMKSLTTRYAGQLHVDVLPQTLFFFLNNRTPPFNDPRVRRAVNYALDRGHIATLVGGPQVGQPTCQSVPPSVPGYRPYCPYTLNPTPAGLWTAPDWNKAVHLVAVSRTRGTRVVVWSPAGRAGLSTYFVSILRRLGYRASLRLVPDGTYFMKIGDPRSAIQAGPVSYLGLPAAFDFIQPLFACQQGQSSNTERFCDPAVDSQILKAARGQAAGLVQANLLWTKLDREMVDRAVLAPLLSQRAAIVVSRRVGNYQFNPQWGPLFDQMWVR